MGRYDDVNPMDIDPETNEPYRGYSSPSLDTSFHDGEMDVDDKPEPFWAGGSPPGWWVRFTDADGRSKDIKHFASRDFEDGELGAARAAEALAAKLNEALD